MDRSMTLLNAQVQFLDTTLALIHIPLSLYPHFIQPILRLLSLVGAEDGEHESTPRKCWAYSFPFTNISVTTLECSIVCPRDLVEEHFVPILTALGSAYQNQVFISKDNFVVIQVGGESTEAGQRVLDLTAPLALAGISIFFITSYYSDFILVPQRSRHDVVRALEEQGFAFEEQTDGHMTNISSPNSHQRNTSSPSAFELPAQVPGTPPPTSIEEWQTRTFSMLKKNKIVPLVDPDMRLAICAGPRSDQITQSRLSYAIIRALISAPQFISITLTEMEPVSLTLERRLLSLFPGEEVLLMTDETVVPIMLDFKDLPEESAGIVCGVAGRLIDRMGEKDLGSGLFNMSYLSTAKAGNVIVSEHEFEDALEALKEIDKSEPVGNGISAQH